MIPNSWYMVMPGSALAAGATHTERALGTEFPIARDGAGAVTVRDARGARRHVHEVNDMVLVWEGDTEPAFVIAPCPELADARWTSVRWGRSPVYRTSVVNVQRDVVDNGHFGPVHCLDAAETRASRDGRHFDTVSQGILNLRRLGGPPLLGHIRLDGRLHGLGLLTYRTVITLGVQLRSLVLSAPTPVDDDHVCFHLGIATARIFPGASEIMRRAVLASVLHDIRRDAVHWESAHGRFPGPDVEEPEQARLFAMFDSWLAQHLPAAPAAVTASAAS